MYSIVKPAWGYSACCLLLALTFALSVPEARADARQTLRAADKALAAGDYDKAYDEYMRQAEKDGNPLALFNLALFYEQGWGRSVNPVEACRWHEKAAAGGVPYSSHRLAQCLAEGVGRPGDYRNAANWYRKAADLGHYISLCDLGDLYLQGTGVEKNPAKGLELCLEAAKRDLPQAQLRLAVIYLEGDASLRDDKQALRWLETAARQGLPEAQYRLGKLLREHASDQATTNAARFWLETAASQGYLAAYLPVGELYLDAPRDPQSGVLPANDLAKAYLWLSAATRSLKAEAQLSTANELLARVQAAIPETWIVSLDAKVDAHLAAHPHSQ